MDQILAVLCILSIVLSFVTVVGHGIWLALAWLFRALTGGAAQEPPPRPACPKCGSRYGLVDGRCVVCGAVPQVRVETTLRDELKTTARQLRRLLDRGAISESQYGELVSVIHADLARLGEGLGPEAEPAVGRASQPVEVGRASQPVQTGQETRPTQPAARDEGIIDAVLVDAQEQEADLVPLPPEPRPAAAGTSPFAPQPAGANAASAPAPTSRLGWSAIADMLQSFMEESNIRWGELIAAVLIVISAVGLVISLQSDLSHIPFFAATVFMVFTLAFHGAGLYTLRRWNLQAVSRVVLIISLLLVPLAISGAIVMSGSGETLRPATDPLFLAAVAIGTLVFGWVAYSASSELVGPARWWLTVGVLGCSLSQVLIHRVHLPGLGLWGINAVLAFPLTCFLVAAVGQLAWSARWKQLSEKRVGQILLVLGVATFAFLAPLVLLLMRAEPRWQAAAWLSPALSLAAAAVLALGLLVHRRTTAKALAAYQTAGTAILVFGGVLLAALVGLAWPEPELLIAVGLLNAAVLAVLGVLAALPLLYVPAVACLALAATIGLHLAGGHFADRERLALKVVQALLMGRTSLALTVLAAAVAGLGGWLARIRRRDDALMLLVSTGGLAVVAVAVALFSGFVTVPHWPQDPDLAAPLLAFYAAALLVAAPRVPREGVAYAASVLLWTALVQALYFNDTARAWLAQWQVLPERPVLVATLLHGLVTAGIAVAAAGRVALGSKDEFAAALPSPRQRLLAEPLAIGAVVSLLAIVPFVVWVRGSFPTHAAFALAAAVGWLALAAARRWPWAVSGLQAMLALAPAIWIAGYWRGRLEETNWQWAEPHLLAQLLVLALPAVAWSIARRASSRHDVPRELLVAPWPAVDQILLGVAAVGLPIVTLYAALPGAAWELGFELAAAGTAGDVVPIVASDATPIWLGWAALAAIVVALVAMLWERVSLPALAGLGAATFAAVWLAAGHFEPQVAVASAARWAAGIYVLVWGAAFIARTQFHAGAKRIAWLRWARPEPYAEHWFCAQPLVLGGLTILVLTVIAVMQNASGASLRGPLDGSIFAAMGPTASYAGPLIAIVAVLLGYAVREREAAYALGGSAVFQFAVNLAFILHVTLAAAAQPASIRAIEWWQWNAVAAGAYAVVWLALSRWITPAQASPRSRRIADGLWGIQAAAAAVASTVLVVWAAWTIIDSPAAPPRETALLGTWLSYVAVGLLLAALAWKHLQGWAIDGRLQVTLGDIAAVVLAGLLALIAATLNQYDPGGTWLSYHSLEVGWLVIAAAACGAAYLGGPLAPRADSHLAERDDHSASHRAERDDHRAWLATVVPNSQTVALIGGLALALAIRGNQADPSQPWWSLGTALGCGAIATAMGLARRSQLYAYVATTLAGVAVILYWIAPASDPWNRTAFGDSPAAVEVLVLAVIAAAGFWLWREVRYQMRRDEPFDPRWFGPRVHVAAALLVLPLYALFRLTLALFPRPLISFDMPHQLPLFAALGLLATLALGGLLLAMLWDRRAFVTLSLAYLWGGVAWMLGIAVLALWLGDSVERFNLLVVEHRLTLLLLAVAAHVAIAGQIWSYGANLAAWGTKLGISDTVGGLVRTSKWMPAVNLTLAGLACLAALPLVLLQDELQFRTAAALAPAIAAWGVLCLAQQERKEIVQLASLLMAGLSAIYLGWAQIDPDIETPWGMAYVFRLLMVLAALTFLYGLALPRWLLTEGSWNAATRRAGYVAASLAGGVLLVTLALEAMLYADGRQHQIADIQVAAIAAVLLLFIAGLISMALLPGRDPLLLTETWKQAYVYGAQATGALLFAHLYVCRPEWFDGILRPYWPLVVMGLAFLGVGSAELFRRYSIRVMAEPLERTGAMLPLLPVLGMWVVGSEATPSLVLFVAGILYLVLSVARRHWAAMVAAAVSGNAALWALLHEHDWFFAANPQFWLIPPALSALVAAQVNRHRLPAETLSAIRYAATIVIYVSSTYEIWVRGIGTSLLPPMVLMALAVAGAMAGIMLRVRAFLFLGTTFTLLALLAMVAHASRSIDHVWPWWAFGIGLGIAILVFFGVFEKKRPEVMQLIARLRQWEA